MNDFFTVEMLTTFAGLVAAVALIVQFSKSPIKKKWGDGAVRIYAFVVSLILNTIFIDYGWNAQGIALNILNAILITLSATGAYEMIADPTAEKRLPNR